LNLALASSHRARLVRSPALWLDRGPPIPPHPMLPAGRAGDFGEWWPRKGLAPEGPTPPEHEPSSFEGASTRGRPMSRDRHGDREIAAGWRTRSFYPPPTAQPAPPCTPPQSSS